MLINNRIIEKFKKGEKSLGTFSVFGDIGPDALSYTGLDYVIMDMEHSCMDDSTSERAIAIVAGRGYSPLVRIKETNRTSVLRALDAGAHGLIIPNLKTVQQAKNLVEWGKFMPIGERGLCETRDSGWAMGEQITGTVEAYCEYCNSNTLILPQCETKECLENLEEIVAIDGIDGIFIGPFDLSLSLGIPVQFDNPVFIEAIERIQRVVKEAGKICIIFADDSTVAKQRFAQGYDSVTLSLDATELQRRYAQIVAEAREGL